MLWLKAVSCHGCTVPGPGTGVWFCAGRSPGHGGSACCSYACPTPVSCWMSACGGGPAPTSPSCRGAEPLPAPAVGRISSGECPFWLFCPRGMGGPRQALAFSRASYKRSWEPPALQPLPMYCPAPFCSWEGGWLSWGCGNRAGLGWGVSSGDADFFQWGLSHVGA